MSTHCVVARPKGSDWEGRYVHFDGYPSGAGHDLYVIAHQIGVERMLEIIIDEHPGGWNSLVGDWSQEPGYISRTYTPDETATLPPRCFCHGDRNDPPEPLLRPDTASSDIPYVYVIDGHLMRVCIGGRDVWREAAIVDLDGPEPDWGLIR
jgi:hypothetical protein